MLQSIHTFTTRWGRGGRGNHALLGDRKINSTGAACNALSSIIEYLCFSTALSSVPPGNVLLGLNTTIIMIIMSLAI